MQITRSWPLLLLFASLSLISCKKKQPPPQGSGKGPAPAAAPAPRPAPTATGKTRIHAEPITYRSGGTVLKGYLAYDPAKTGKRPGVLVVHEWWGHNAYARRRARMLARLGYTALAVDMYGDGKQAAHPKDAMKFAGQVMKNLPEGVKRFEAAKKVLENHPTVDKTRIAAIGYCFGGSVVLHMARIGLDLAGVASFHGGLAALAPAKKGAVKAKVLVLHGGADKMASAKVVAAFRKEMADAGADLRFITYPKAMHSFTNPGATEVGKKFKLPLAYDAEADAKSWDELKRFLKEIFAEKK